MKIFQITHEDGEREWVAAHTNIGAIYTYMLEAQCTLKSLIAHTVSELTDKEVENQRVLLKDSDSSITFRQWLEKYKSPGIVAGSFYDRYIH